MGLHLLGALAAVLAAPHSGQVAVGAGGGASSLVKAKALPPSFAVGEWCGGECCTLSVKLDGQQLDLKVCANQTCVTLPDLPTPFTTCVSDELSHCIGNQTTSMVAASGVKLGGTGGILPFHRRIVEGLVALLSGAEADLGGTVINGLVYPIVPGVPADMGSVEQCKAVQKPTRYCLWNLGGSLMLAGSCVPLECSADLQLQAVLYQADLWKRIGQVIHNMTGFPTDGLDAAAGMLTGIVATSNIGCGGVLNRIGQEGDHESESTLNKSFGTDSNAKAVAVVIIVIFLINVLATISLRVPKWLCGPCSRGEDPSIQDPESRGPAASPTDGSFSASRATPITDTTVGAAARVPHGSSKSSSSGACAGFRRLLKCFDLVDARDGFLKVSARRPTSFLNGIRVISILWVVLGHVLVYPFAPGFDNQSEIDKYYVPSFRTIILGSAFYAVDTFFFLSGFLACYSFTDPKKGWLKRTGTNPVKNVVGVVMVYIDRWMRLTPLYALLIFFAAYLLQYFGTGPFWMAAANGGSVGDNCAKYWYQNIFYYNNMPGPVKHMCFGHSWYLANDMQFLLVGTPIMVFFTHKPVVGWALTLALMVMSLGIILNRLGDPQLSASGGKEYMRPYIRVAPYLYGLMTCYLIRQQGEALKRWANNLIVRWAAYFVAFGLMLGAMVWQWDTWQHCGGFMSCGNKDAKLGTWVHPWDSDTARAFGFYYHFAWGLGLGILTCVWCCGHETRTGGWVVDFLSHPVFEPLYRLTYGVYLIHPMVLLCIKLTGSTVNHFTDYWLLSTWIAGSVGAYVASFLTYLFVERPSSLLWDLASSRNKRRSSPHTQGVVPVHAEETARLIAEDKLIDSIIPDTASAKP